ncbi:MAG TPA: SGNH/GDSL hydrolase family protein [Vicinamibacteria bacterium]|nr:SGNH/GDSL hydrolase family protein [Vicinamibacteria bacterium]
MTAAHRSLAPGSARVVGLVLLLAGCGGGSPSAPPTPPPDPGFTVRAVVFYDENGSGALEGAEPVRIPDVEVTVAGRSGRTATRTGEALVTGVPAGTFPLAVRSETLPPFFRAGPPASVTVPTAEGPATALALTLPIGNNQPNVYMAFGDSQTAGDGLPASAAWPARLQALLEQHLGGAVVRNRGATGTNTFESLERLQRNLNGNEPAYTLILYGINDWHDPLCKEQPDCHTVPNLRTVVQRVEAFHSLPFVATLAPVNPALNPAERNGWVAAVNERIRVMAREEGAFLVDLHRAFTRRGDIASLYLDHVHFNQAGHDLVAAAWFEAIAHGRSE